MRTLLIALAVLLAGCGSAGAGPVGPTPSPSPTALDPVRVTLADNNTTVHVHVDQTVQVALGDQMEWHVTRIGDQSVLSAIPGVNTLVRGTQLLARAHQVGTTTLDAEGRPVCASGQVCSMVIATFHVTIDVAP